MKIYCVTLTFSSANIVKQGLSHCRSLMRSDIHHYLVDQHYPLGHDKIRQVMLDYARTYDNVTLLDSGSAIGLNRGLNFFLGSVDLKPEDVVITLDPDSWPHEEGWDLALVKAFSDPRVGAVSLMNPTAKEELGKKGYEEKYVDGLRMWEARGDVMTSIGAWRGKFLINCGGFKANREHYGHMEAPMWDALGKYNYSWVYLPAYTEDTRLRQQHDRSYTQWKWVSSHLQSWKGDYESYLVAGCPVPKDYPCPEQIP